MKMSPQPRFPRVLAVWLVSVPTLLLVAWFSGYLYWQVRIGRAITEIHRQPGTHVSSANPELLRIGSRGIPRFVAELEGALSRDDDEQARAFTRGLIDLIAGFYDLPAQQANDERSRFQSRKEIEQAVRDYRNMSPEERAQLPPWWMWWKGRRK